MRRRRALQFTGSVLASTLAGCSAVRSLTAPSEVTKAPLSDLGAPYPWPTQGGNYARDGSIATRGPRSPENHRALYTLATDASRRLDFGQELAVGAATVVTGWDQPRSGHAESSDVLGLSLKPDQEQPKWRAGRQSQMATATIHGGTAFVTTRESTRALDVRDGTQYWGVDAGSFVRTASPAVVGDTLLVPAEKHLAAYSAIDGTTSWTSASFDAPLRGVAVESERRAYVATGESETGRLFAIDLSDGSIEWKYDAEATSYEPPAVGETYAFIRAGGLRAIATDDGTPQWEAPTIHPPAIDDGTVFTTVSGSPGATLAAHDERTGEELWNVPTDLTYVSPPRTDGTSVYLVGIGDSKPRQTCLLVIDRAKQTITDRYCLDGVVAHPRSFVLGDGAAYLVGWRDRRYRLYAVA